MYEYIFLILVLVHLTDCVSTVIGLGHSNSFEKNPVAAYLFAKVGVLPGLLFYKGGVLAILFSLHHFALVPHLVNIALATFFTVIISIIVYENICGLVREARLKDQ